MTRFLYLLLVTFYFIPFTVECNETSIKKPKICLNMIVKNESAVIKRSLSSVLPIIDYWVIVDTGSTDDTQKVITDFMKEKNIPGELIEKPWVNFAHNRNEALQLAKGKSEYILFLDADDYYEFDPDFKFMSLDKDYYYIPIHYGTIEYSRILLIRQGIDWNWVGALHEVLVPKTSYTFANLRNIKCIPTGNGDRSKNEQKYAQDAQILEQELEKDPNSTRNRFYLAQSYYDAKNYPKALENYEKRIAMGGWDEEVFFSMYRIGLLQEDLKMQHSTIIASYNRAYQYRNSRVEPLYRLASLENRAKNFEKAYEIGKIALTIPASKDILFVEKWTYDYGVALELSVSAYWLEKYEECKLISQELLNKELPQNIKIIVQNNLNFANAKLIERLINSKGIE